MSMWFFDEASDMEEYQNLKKYVQTVEKEYLELLALLQSFKSALAAEPHNHGLQVRVKYLEKRIRHLEEKNPWLLWDTPIEMALFSPPHG